jgi:DNA-binding transcriptional ArsR family regulator
MTPAGADPFAAIADPTRRGLIETLAEGPATATRLAGGLPITRQAVSKHLSILRDASLVGSRRSGRETIYTLQPDPLREVAAWSERVGRDWDRRLAKLEDVVSS